MKTHYSLTLAMAALCSLTVLPSCSSDDLLEMFGFENAPDQNTMHGKTFAIASNTGTQILFSSNSTAAEPGVRYDGCNITIGSCTFTGDVTYDSATEETHDVRAKVYVTIDNFTYVSGDVTSIGLTAVTDIDSIDQITFKYRADSEKCYDATVTMSGYGELYDTLAAFVSNSFNGGGSFY